MYEFDQPEISEYVLRNEDNTVRLFQFVFLTIQQRFDRMAEQMASVDALGVESPFLFGHKRVGFAHVLANKRDLWLMLQDCDGERLGNVERDTLLALASIPGLGLVKAGFVLQCAVSGLGGCLDTHNMRRFGLNPNSFRFGPKATYTLQQKKAELYIETCKRNGGAEVLWDSWCEYIARLYPKIWRSPEHVSTYHVDCIQGEYSEHA